MEPLSCICTDVQAAETRVRPSAMREVALEVPAVGWGDVGGLEDIKQSLKVRACPSLPPLQFKYMYFTHPIPATTPAFPFLALTECARLLQALKS